MTSVSKTFFTTSSSSSRTVAVTKFMDFMQARSQGGFGVKPPERFSGKGD